MSLRMFFFLSIENYLGLIQIIFVSVRCSADCLCPQVSCLFRIFCALIQSNLRDSTTFQWEIIDFKLPVACHAFKIELHSVIEWITIGVALIPGIRLGYFKVLYRPNKRGGIVFPKSWIIVCLPLSRLPTHHCLIKRLFGPMLWLLVAILFFASWLICFDPPACCIR